MKIIKETKVQIRLGDTLATMEVGDVWKVPPQFSLRYLRVFCSTYGAAVNKSFTVNAPEQGSEKLPQITRTR